MKLLKTQFLPTDRYFTKEQEDGRFLYFLKDTKNTPVHLENYPALFRREAGRQVYIWIKNGYLHRIDGPAIERAPARSRYFLNGKELTKSEFFVEQTNYNLKKISVETGSELDISQL